MKQLVDSNTLKVKILGHDYDLDTGSLTELEANQLASYVDEKMREISEGGRIVDTQKIAVLASLNIALELQGHQQKKESVSDAPAVKQEAPSGTVTGVDGKHSDREDDTDEPVEKVGVMSPGQSYGENSGFPSVVQSDSDMDM